MRTPEEDNPDHRADPVDDASAGATDETSPSDSTSLLSRVPPLSRRWAPVAVVALALALGALLMAVWPANTPREASASVAAPAPTIPVARPVSPTPSTAASDSATTAASPDPTAMGTQSPTSPASAPAAEGGVVTGIVENVDGLPNTVVAMGEGPVHGDPNYGLLTYTVETDQAHAGELPELLRTVETTFSNTTQGWTARTGQALQRVGSTDLASIRIILASPALVDETCARVGLDTAGLYSCWDGAHTMLNSDRWFQATPEFTDLSVYRTYLINHEFGHGLGFDHEYCPGPGEVAPVMQQQSISLQGCQPNGWPIP